MTDVKLTIPEINHLLSLIHSNEHEGWYYPPKKQWENRQEKIKDKLVIAKRGYLHDIF